MPLNAAWIMTWVENKDGNKERDEHLVSEASNWAPKQKKTHCSRGREFLLLPPVTASLEIRNIDFVLLETEDSGTAVPGIVKPLLQRGWLDQEDEALERKAPSNRKYWGVSETALHQWERRRSAFTVLRVMVCVSVLSDRGVCCSQLHVNMCSFW